MQDTAALEQADLLAVGESVGEGRDAPVRIDFEVPLFFLAVGGDVDVLDFVGEAELFESDGDFDAVGGGVCVEGYVGALGGHGGCCWGGWGEMGCVLV